MNRRFFWGMCLAMVVFGTATAWAGELSRGVHGMRWADHVAGFKNLEKVHAKGPAVYYTDKTVSYQVSGTQVAGVIYGFYQDRLFAAFIKLATPLQFSNLTRHFKTRHGDPKTVYSTQNEQTTYRWRDGDITIKLKRRETDGDMKLAIYYTPLSAKLNREQAEQLPEKSFRFLPIDKNKRPEALPLFEF